MVNKIEILELLQTLKQGGVALWIENSRLKTKAPKGAITPELRQRIKANLDDIVRILESHKENGAVKFLAPIPKIAPNAYYPLSNAQRRLWVLDQIDGQLNAYNIPVAMRLKGDLEVTALESALHTVLERHEILRTRFVIVQAEGMQQIDEVENYHLPIQETTSAAITSLAQQHANRVFNLATEHAINIKLFKITDAREQEHLLLFNMHHIISDAWSLDILVKEINQIYTNIVKQLPKTTNLPALPIQYKDYAVWQNNLLKDEETLSELRNYWLDHLADLTVLDLPIDNPRPSQKNYNGTSAYYTFSKKLSTRLYHYTQERGATLFFTLTALVNILLYRYTNQTDIVMGTTTAGRNHPDLDGQIGFYINTLALRSQINPADNFEKLLAQVKEHTLKAFEHEQYPFDRLVEELDLPRDPSRSTVFDVMISLHNSNKTSLSFGDVAIEPVTAKVDNSKFDLTFIFGEGEDGLQGCIEYNTDLYRPERIERMFGHFECLIQSVIENDQQTIADIDIVPPAERQMLLTTLNAGAETVHFPVEKTVIDLFEQQAAKTPHNTAVVFENRTLTYQQLNEQANRVAQYLLQTYSIQTDDIIALQLERSEWMMIAILGVLKSGAAYLPIATDLPKARAEYMLKDSAAKILLVDDATSNTAKHLDISIEIENIQQIELSDISAHIANCKPEQLALAYIIYTSGSTAQPKGVMITQRAFYNLVCGVNHLSFSKIDKQPVLHIGQIASYAFDASIQTLFGSICFGHQLYIVPDELKRNGAALSQFIADNEIHAIDITPVLFNILLQGKFAERNDLSLRQILIGGDVLNTALLNDFYKKTALQSVEIYNVYGPTEATVNSTYYQVTPAALEKLTSIPIGKPLPNYEIFIANTHAKLQPFGTVGELLIGGTGLARGYLNNEALTNEKFIPHPFRKGQRLYKTGDLARWLPDGNVEFLGRIDFQLKIRGYRIEAGEIEQTLLSHDDIQHAVVIGLEGENGKELVAYFVSKATAPNVATMRTFLSRSLPTYMIPNHFVALESLPLTRSGKVDRKALPQPDTSTVETGTATVAPRNAKEHLVHAIWQGILHKPSISIYDNFYHVGGDSIKALQITARLVQEEWQFSISDFFAYLTIAEQAAHLKPKTKTYDQSVVTGKIPLTAVQQRFFNYQYTDEHHFNQAIMLEWSNGHADIQQLTGSFKALMQHHDMLRVKYELGEIDAQGNRQINQSIAAEIDDFEFKIIELPDGSTDELKAFVKEQATLVQSSFDFSKGQLIKVALFHDPSGNIKDQILIAIHHLAIDGVSWRIILENLQTVYSQLQSKKPTSLPQKTASFQLWSNQIRSYVKEKLVKNEQEVQYWSSVVQQAKSADAIPINTITNKANNKQNNTVVSLTLSEAETKNLLENVPAAYNTEINHILLAALSVGLKKTFGGSSYLIELEGHGREAIVDLDISQTVGWFTTLFPFVLQHHQKAGLGHHLQQVKETLRNIPNKGIGYGLLRYLGGNDWSGADTSAQEPMISFNFLGDFRQNNQKQGADKATEGNYFGFSSYPTGATSSPNMERGCEMDISGIINSEGLRLSISYAKDRLDQTLMEQLISTYKAALLEIIAHCQQVTAPRSTPSDFTACPMNLEEYESFLDHHQLKAAAIEDIYPLSPMQEGMLFHSLLQPNSIAYLMQMQVSFGSSINIERFKNCWKQLIKRHAVLRTAFYTGKTGSNMGAQRPLQVAFKKDHIDWGAYFEVIDISRMQPSEQTTAIANYRAQDQATNFDTSKLPLIRFIFLYLGENNYELIQSSHHILSDGWSSGILFKELMELYESQESVNLPPVTSYGKYINWLEKQPKEKAGQFWANYLEGYEAQTLIPDLNTDNNDAQLTLSPQEHGFNVGETVTKDLEQLAAQCQVSLNTVMQAIWAILLGRYNQCQDVVFGMTTSGRSVNDDALLDIENIVGPFINTVPVRIQWSDSETFTDLVQSIHQQAVSAQAYEYYPLAQIQQKATNGQRTLFDHLMAFENFPVDEQLSNIEQPEDKNRLEVKAASSQEEVHYGMSLVMYPGTNLKIKIKWNEAAWNGEWAKRMEGHFEVLINNILNGQEKSVSQLRILPKAEQKLLETFNNTIDYTNDKTIIDLFEEQVKKAPDNIAVIFQETKLSYRELHEKSNQIAHYLRQTYDTQADDIIALQLRRSEWMIIAILGILKSGAAYLPIDLDYPKNRVNYILENSGAKALLTDNNTYADTEPATCQIPIENIEQIKNPVKAGLGKIATSKDLAYILYTSGTTGQPKGVMIEHKAIINTIAGQIKYLEVTNQDRVINFSRYTFDVSVWEFWVALLSGASLVVVSEQVVTEPTLFLETMAAQQVSISVLPPPFLTILDKRKMSSLRILISGGDTARSEDLYHYAQYFKCYNACGPTEGAVYFCIYKINPLLKKESKLKSIPIGKPISNMEVLLLDNNKNLVPIGVPGALYLSGIGIARGYLNAPEITAEKFIPHPFKKGEKLYETGDLARWLPDGNIEFIGRIDHQLKIRGYRIEAGEIEQSLLLHHDIQSTIVIGHDSGSGKELVAYIVPKEGQQTPDVKTLRTFLGINLPDYMIPSHFIALDSLPMTSSGKVNRKSLPAPDTTGINTGVEYAAPCNDVEITLAQIWQNILGKTKISRHDNFFNLGGHSLRVIQLVSIIETSFGLKLPLQHIFQYPTIAKLAEKISTQEKVHFTNSMVFNPNATNTLFAFPAFFGEAIFYQKLAELCPDTKWISFDFLPSDDRLAIYHKQIKKQQPTGPYVLFGYSSGARLIYELARYLEAQGETVRDIILGDGSIPLTPHDFNFEEHIAERKQKDDFTEDDRKILDNPQLLQQIKRRVTAYNDFLNQLNYNYKINANIHNIVEEKPTENSELLLSKDWSLQTKSRFMHYAAKGIHSELFNPPNLADNALLLSQILADTQRRKALITSKQSESYYLEIEE